MKVSSDYFQVDQAKLTPKLSQRDLIFRLLVKSLSKAINYPKITAGLHHQGKDRVK